MKYFIRTGAAIVMALFAILVLLPSKATGLGESGQPAHIAGWLYKTIENHIKEELAGPQKTVESVKVTLPERYIPPTEYDSMEISIPRQNRLGNRMFISVKFIKGSNIISRVNAMALVKVMIEVVVANRDLGAGAIVADADIRMKKQAIGSGFSNVITDSSMVIGKQVDRKIRAGSPFMKSSVSIPKLVRLGDVVTIVARSGQFTITTLGKARQNGDRGEWISIMNVTSKKIINAQVTGPRTVRVEF
ncbi:hypothetical protein MNBD_NITROSPINAE02-1556 [hydrothermal vent metagenome]|uniref:SAF domain-containing protein n=1 Tax=hydrothermal vent metagenome TaxID=652676 RepID=A0A3B1BL57_9ZZZZ